MKINREKKVEIATDDNIAQILQEETRIVIIDFWAEWCGPCRMLLPVLEELSAEIGDKVRFVKMNVDDCPEMSGKMHIRSIPTLALFKDNKHEATMSGFKNKDDLKLWIEEYI